MSFISNITNRIFDLQDFRKRQLVFNEYRDHFRNRLVMHEWDPEQKVEGEEKYLSVWQQLCPRIEPYSYRFFSRYSGKNPYILPEDLGRTYIEYYLNPLRYRSFYSDKNLYEQYISPKELFPKVYYRRIMGGKILDTRFHLVKQLDYAMSSSEFARMMPVDRVVLKRTNDSGGGHDVQCIERKEDGLFYSNRGMVIDGEFLQKFAPDWNIQEVINQHPFFAQFSKTSLNSMRIFTYRSVVDEAVYLYSAIVRIGHEGSFVDNLTQGGGFVKIDIETGKLVGKVFDEEGYIYDSINGVDFSKEYVIPQWKEIKDTAMSIARQIRHCHLVALDLCLDDSNTIRMLEHNIGDCSYWISLFIGDQVFGDRIQEVIDYCVEQKKHDPRFRYINK